MYVGERFHSQEVDAGFHAHLGLMSLLLTIVNIFCVYICAMMVFWIKKVAPIKGELTRESLAPHCEYTFYLLSFFLSFLYYLS